MADYFIRDLLTPTTTAAPAAAEETAEEETAAEETAAEETAAEETAAATTDNRRKKLTKKEKNQRKEVF